jgi:hypothetical protein
MYLIDRKALAHLGEMSALDKGSGAGDTAAEVLLDTAMPAFAE